MGDGRAGVVEYLLGGAEAVDLARARALLGTDAGLEDRARDAVFLDRPGGVRAREAVALDGVGVVGGRGDPVERVGALGRGDHGVAVALVALDDVGELADIRVQLRRVAEEQVGRTPACWSSWTTRDPTLPVGVVTMIFITT